MMQLRVDVHLYLHDDEQGLGKRLDAIVASIATLREDIMATVQEVLDDLDAIKTQTGSYIAGRDAIDVGLKQQIVDLTAQVAAGTATAADLQAGIDAAFVKAEEDKALLAVPAVTPPA